MNDQEAQERWRALRSRGRPAGWADKVVNSASGWPLAYMDAGCAAALGAYFERRRQMLDVDSPFRDLQALLPEVQAAVTATDGSPEVNSYFVELRSLLKYVEACTRLRA